VREILFVAGEVSGDLHAAGVARALVSRGAPYALVGVGGDRMRDAGVTLLQHNHTLAVMGIIEPLKLLPSFYRLRRALHRRLAGGNVALVVLVDYAGFNMRIAELAAAEGVPVLYFITPQVWASRAGRMARLARSVTRAAVILPFEAALLREHGVNATFVGHPLLDRALTMPDRASARAAIGISAHDRLLVLFPGSRPQEIARHLEPFVATALELQRRDPTLKVVVGAAPHVAIPAERCPFPLVYAASFALLRAADAAMCKSGTTTLEAAIALCPLVVAYRTSAMEFAIARRIVKIPLIGLVNIVAGREVAREFVQDALQPVAVADVLERLLDPASPERAAMVRDLAQVRDSLGEPGAAARVADIALELAGGSHASAAT
jgi:lipid-A-disaccharide synthase